MRRATVSVRGYSYVLFGAVVASSFGGCEGMPSEPVEPAGMSGGLAESADARARIANLRARHGLGVAAASGFQAGPTGGLRATLAATGTRAVGRPATVELPWDARGGSRLEDEASHLRITFALHDAKPARVAVAAGYALYAGALEGADVVHRVHAEGTEDYVFFESRPSREALAYDVDVSRVPGLRLVSNTLEFIDETGTPVLRVAPPYVVDARRERHEASLGVSGCAYDTNPAGPWGRPIVRPGAARCTVHVAWGGVPYPAMVDPAWGTTGSMTLQRTGATATTLSTGLVLVAGGHVGDYGSTSTAELFSEAVNAGSGTFAATGAMHVVRYEFTATRLASGKVLLAGGGPGSSSAEVYDPANGTYPSTVGLLVGRTGHSATLLASGKVLLVGGTSVSSAELYDPAAGAATNVGSMSISRVQHASAVLPSGRVLVTGGFDVASKMELDTTEIWNPAGNGGLGSFSAGPSLSLPRRGHTATVLLSGKVLIAGGAQSAMVFDPAANGGAGGFGNDVPMNANRAQHTATLLTSGKVLLAGGVSDTSAELFDPAANGGLGRFSVTASMNTPRGQHVAARLPSGRVLVAGGGANGPSSWASAEIYGGALGDACLTASACLSGFCADGVCCNEACDKGSCDRCDLDATGTCKLAPEANPGASPICALPYACDGVSKACPTSCTTDAQCAPQYYCASDATCQPRRAQGNSCNAQADCKTPGCRECLSAFCVDGTCCNEACNGTCQACSSAFKQDASPDGTCGNAKNGIDPHDQCAPSGVLCGADGQCNGAGGCRIYSPAGLSCGPGQCKGTTALGELCDGAGTCTSNVVVGVDCAPARCVNGGCSPSCVTTADCAPTGWCSGGVCVSRSASGQPCARAEQCLTNECSDGTCCDKACNGQCEACNLASSKGTCSPVVGAPQGGRPACAGGPPGQPCAATLCDGVLRASCNGLAGPEVVCGEAACRSGTATILGTCDGEGTCKAPPAVSCGAYACGASECKTRCDVDGDCAVGHTCDPSTSKCVAGATCDDHIAHRLNGTTVDCAPYKCSSTGECRSECTSVGDCVAPAVCDASGKCTAPAKDDGAGGCGVAAGGRSGAPAWLLAVLAVLARRRRGQRFEGVRS